MGDRANIVIKTDGDQVCLYSHWGGSDLPQILKDSLIIGKSRVTDYQYINRIIFQQMINGDDSLTGYGISQNPFDGGDRVVEFDVDAQVINLGNKTYSVSDYVSDGFSPEF